MTDTHNSQEKIPESGRLSLPFDPADLAQGIRVRPAQFARMCNVSRQTASQWVKRGLVQLFPDGTLDPAQAAKRVIQNTDPARLRARIFSDLTKTVDDWKREAKAAKAELLQAKERIQYLEGRLREDELIEKLFLVELEAAASEIAAAAPDTVPGLLEKILDDCITRAGEQLQAAGQSPS